MNLVSVTVVSHKQETTLQLMEVWFKIVISVMDPSTLSELTNAR